jgi:hypothetical protein
MLHFLHTTILTMCTAKKQNVQVKILSPGTRKCCPYADARMRTLTWQGFDPGNEKKGLCFKWVPFEASVEVEIWKRSVVLRSPDVNR